MTRATASAAPAPSAKSAAPEAPARAQAPAKAKARTKTKAPARRSVRAAPASQVALLVTVSDQNGVNTYVFAYGGVSVPTSGGHGTFYATKGKQELLEWDMIGQGGGTMKVVVTRDGAVIDERDASTITRPGPKGYDALQILVS